MTGDAKYAAFAAGMSPVSGGAQRALQRPAVQAEVLRVHTELLWSELLPLAYQAHVELLKDPRTPAGARVQAVKLAYDRTLGVQDENQAKEPHEMTAEEIAAAIKNLEDVASARAKPVDSAQDVRKPANIFE
ncbi:MAG: hypothetical protein ACOVN5_07205 [Aquidulcibacter sp.]